MLKKCTSITFSKYLLEYQLQCHSYISKPNLNISFLISILFLVENNTTLAPVSVPSTIYYFRSIYKQNSYSPAFGIGSMIYSGLEFGQYFELEKNTKCHNLLLALTPATRMAFIFIQMYFIFLNNEVRNGHNDPRNFSKSFVTFRK